MCADRSVSIVICAYTLDRWADIAAAVASATNQTHPADLLLVIDHNDALRARASEAWPGLQVLASTGPAGLSGARNTGVQAASTDIVAFLDDDARAAPGWLEALLQPYADDRVIATGGFARAAWDRGRPRWFPAEFDWVVGCSYRGLPARPARVRNPIGSNMSFRRDAVLEAGGFRSDIGRVGRFPVGGEETELCIRIQHARPEGRVIFVPSATVEHRVRAERATWAYFRSRCYQEGRSKAYISAIAGAGPALATERSYTVRTLPTGVARGLGDALRGDLSGFARAGTIVAGVAVTTAGYLAGRLGLDAIAAGSRREVSGGEAPTRDAET